MTSKTGGETIRLKGIPQTNTGPVGDSDDPELFANGIVGGSISEKLSDAESFREKFSDTAGDDHSGR